MAQRLSLKLHRDSICEAVSSIDVEAVRSSSGGLELRYIVAGAAGELSLPPVSPAVRTDGLWKHTCFEAFVRTGCEEFYREFNFSPSTQWAAYAFDSYRGGMRPADLEPPRINTGSSAGGFELQVALEPDLPFDTAWQIGLSAVIEEANGRKSYWALAHPVGKADFHHPDSFVHELR